MMATINSWTNIVKKSFNVADEPKFIIPNNVDKVDSMKFEYGEISKFHYNENASSDNELKVRGWVVDDKNNILSRSIPFIYEFSVSDDKIYDYVDKDAKNVKYSYFYENTVMYVWWNPYTSSWFLSTHKKINAFESFWGIVPKSFGQQFIDILGETDVSFDKFVENFNKDYTYVFFMIPDSNFRNVSSILTEADIVRSQKINNKTGASLPILDSEMTTWTLDASKEIINFSSVEEARAYVNTCYKDKMSAPGLFLTFPDGKQVKILNDYYSYLSFVRGNDPNHIRRYFQLRNTEHINAYMSIYNDIDFGVYESLIVGVAYRITDCYIQRYVLNQYCIIPPKEYKFLQSILDVLKSHTDNNHYNVVLDHLNNMKPDQLWNMIM